MFFFVCFAALFIATCYGQSQSVAIDDSSPCTQRNGYVAVPSSCDNYIICRNYTAIDAECPDGLHFNTAAAWPDFPCGFPSDVPCKLQSGSQPAQATADCPHQYGYFPSPLATAPDCSRYRICVAGKAIEMSCPAGLAFDSARSRCDWAEKVPGCNVDDYLGFKCPPPTVDSKGFPIETNYPYSGDCYAFYACASGEPRLLSCDPGLAFDADKGFCVNEDLVKCKTNAKAYPV